MSSFFFIFLKLFFSSTLSRFHALSKKGAKTKDIFMTIVETAKKLAVNAYHYFYDRISKKYEMPSLASLIEQNAKQLAPDTG